MGNSAPETPLRGGDEEVGQAHQHGEGVFLVLLLQEDEHVGHQQHQDVWGESGVSGGFIMAPPEFQG